MKKVPRFKGSGFKGSILDTAEPFGPELTADGLVAGRNPPDLIKLAETISKLKFSNVQNSERDYMESKSKEANILSF
jgi:hypothetical protein